MYASVGEKEKGRRNERRFITQTAINSQSCIPNVVNELSFVWRKFVVPGWLFPVNGLNCITQGPDASIYGSGLDVYLCGSVRDWNNRVNGKNRELLGYRCWWAWIYEWEYERFLVSDVEVVFVVVVAAVGLSPRNSHQDTLSSHCCEDGVYHLPIYLNTCLP